MGKFFDYVEKLPALFKQLTESQDYRINELTEGRIKEILGESSPVKGVYLMYDNEVPMYVGNSKTLAQKAGEDERAKNKSTVVKKIMGSDKNIISIDKARTYLFENYTVKFIRIDDDILRAMFAMYVATELHTPFNSFMET